MQTKANYILNIATPKAGVWVLLTELEKVTGAVLLDPTSPDYNKAKSYAIRGFPNGVALVKLRWSKFVTEDDLRRKAIDTKGQEIDDSKMWSSPRRFEGSNYIIATREEWVHLKQFELHPFVAEVTSSDGAYMEIVLLVNYEITNPILAITCPDIFEYAIGILSQEFRSYLGGKYSYKQMRSLETDGCGIPNDIEKKIAQYNGDRLEKVLDENGNVKVTDGKEELRRVKQPINRDPSKRGAFERFGFRVDTIAVSLVALSEESKEFRESEEKIAIAENDLKVAAITLEIEKKQNEAQGVRNKTELEYREKDANIRINLLNKTADAVHKMNKAWTEGSLTHVIFGSGGQNANPAQLVTDLVQVQDFADHDTDDRRKPKKSGGNK